MTFLEDFPHVKTFSIGWDKFGFSISFQPEYKDITITQRKPLKNQWHFQLSSCRDEEWQGFTTTQDNTTKQLSLVFDVMWPILNSQQLRNITGQYIESKYPQNTFSKQEVIEFLNLLFDDLLK